MSEFMGPPMGWYDPPEGHRPECNCEDCHQQHIESGEFAELAKTPDFLCCQDELEGRIDEGRWCVIHGGGAMENKLCLECEDEKAQMFKRAVGE